MNLHEAQNAFQQYNRLKEYIMSKVFEMGVAMKELSDEIYKEVPDNSHLPYLGTCRTIVFAQEPLDYDFEYCHRYLEVYEIKNRENEDIVYFSYQNNTEDLIEVPLRWFFLTYTVLKPELKNHSDTQRFKENIKYALKNQKDEDYEEFLRLKAIYEKEK